MQNISIDEAKTNFDDVMHLVANGKQRFRVRDGKRDWGAIVPPEDLHVLDVLDKDKRDPAERVDIETVRADLDAHFGAGKTCGERCRLVRDGEGVAGLVPHDDLTLLEGMDGRLDMEAAKRLLEEQMNEGNWES